MHNQVHGWGSGINNAFDEEGLDAARLLGGQGWGGVDGEDKPPRGKSH